MSCCKDPGNHDLEYVVDEVNLELAVDAVETWIKETEDGKRWLAEMAATVGVPVQLALPFGKEK